MNTCTETSQCGLATLERPRYFGRQLVTPAELNLESQYFVERHRRHNLMLHGWGVVCGAKVCRVPASDGSGTQPWKVEIRPGYLIDGHGNDVTIGTERIVNLRSTGVVVTCDDPPGELSDPWCNDVWVEREAGRLWVAVCHRPCLVRPVRVQPSGCGCDDTGCEYSRWQDGYEVRLLSACPESHHGPPPTQQQFLAGLKGPLRECPTCPEDPCVVLAAVNVAADGRITAIDNCSCRRMVVSLADVWWRCAGGAVSITSVEEAEVGPHPPGTADVNLKVKGAGLKSEATVDLGPGVTVTQKNAAANGATLNLVVNISADAVPGERWLTITNTDCSSASWPKALTVKEA